MSSPTPPARGLFANKGFYVFSLGLEFHSHSHSNGEDRGDDQLEIWEQIILNGGRLYPSPTHPEVQYIIIPSHPKDTRTTSGTNTAREDGSKILKEVQRYLGSNQINLENKVMLKSGWMSDCLKNGRLLDESDDWGGWRIRIEHPISAKMQVYRDPQPVPDQPIAGSSNHARIRVTSEKLFDIDPNSAGVPSSSSINQKTTNLPHSSNRLKSRPKSSGPSTSEIDPRSEHSTAPQRIKIADTSSQRKFRKRYDKKRSHPYPIVALKYPGVSSSSFSKPSARISLGKSGHASCSDHPAPSSVPHPQLNIASLPAERQNVERMSTEENGGYESPMDRTGFPQGQVHPTHNDQHTPLPHNGHTHTSTDITNHLINNYDDRDLDCLDSDYEDESDDSDLYIRPEGNCQSLTPELIFQKSRNISEDLLVSVGSASPEIQTPRWQATLPKVQQQQLASLRWCWNDNPGNILYVDERLHEKMGDQDGDFAMNTFSTMEETRSSRQHDHSPEAEDQTTVRVSTEAKVANFMSRDKMEDAPRTKRSRSASSNTPSATASCGDTSRLFINTEANPLVMYLNTQDPGLIGQIESHGGQCTTDLSHADIILFHRDRLTGGSQKDLSPKTSGEFKLFRQAFERGQNVLSCLWVEDCINAGHLCRMEKYTIWLSEEDLPKQRRAAIRADERRHDMQQVMQAQSDTRAREKISEDIQMVAQRLSVRGDMMIKEVLAGLDDERPYRSWLSFYKRHRQQIIGLMGTHSKHREYYDTERMGSDTGTYDVCDTSSEVLELGSELGSDEEFDGDGGVRKIGEKHAVRLHFCQ